MSEEESKFKFANLKLNGAKEVSEYATKFLTETEYLITNTIPAKIFSLEKMSKEEFEVYDINDSSLDADTGIPLTGLRHQIDYSLEDPPNHTSTNHVDGISPGGAKKRKFTPEATEDETAANSKPMQVIPCNKKVTRLIDLLKPEIKHIIETCEKVQMWIQLLIPRIEDGNNFGVSIQEEVLNEVSRIQSECIGYLDYISRYYITRAKLATKVAKYPFVDDYRRSVKEIDDKQFLNMKISLNEIRNQYLLILDIVSKNYEKIKVPRTVRTQNMY